NVAKALASNPDPDVLLARDSMEKPFFVSADERADDVLPLMRKHRHPLALVSERDSGAVLGIITEEDVIFALTASL
ncbi:MAG: CBS domain-containing protein, partial [Kiritimatiellae bacterium]|nr:CBS domain-containing protein [Kiritimatiellia bacterium]